MKRANGAVEYVRLNQDRPLESRDVQTDILRNRTREMLARANSTAVAGWIVSRLNSRIRMAVAELSAMAPIQNGASSKALERSQLRTACP
jgi:hypothetical protein